MPKSQKKYIFITGGIVSGIGKGLVSAAISLLLKSRGFSVLPIKADGYLNVDAGTMNPYRHGEVFVTEDGSETDLDLGHYERFLDINLDKSSIFTAGSIYQQVMKLERRGDYLGRDIQIIPHVTDEVKRKIAGPVKSKKSDIGVIEIGGTVGDIESEIYIEAIRQMRGDYGFSNTMYVHVVKMDYLFPSGEEKTKPIQQSSALLRERGIQPDFLMIRCKNPIHKENIAKLSLFTNVAAQNIIQVIDVNSLYQIPLNFEAFGLGKKIVKRLELVGSNSPELRNWKKIIARANKAKNKVSIGIIGKYLGNDDTYISVEESVRHAAAHLGVTTEINYINAETKNISSKLEKSDGILVPGGFGKRGILGKIKAIQYARENNIPFLGLCLGMQAAVIEFARNVCSLKEAHSTEFNKRTKHPVVDIMPDQKKKEEKGGTMRLGSSQIIILPNTLIHKLYGDENNVSERHRHRYEINPEYHKKLSEKGIVFSGFYKKDKRLAEFIELPNHKYFVATQAHPEFKSRFIRPHPLFMGFIKAAAGK